MKSFNSSMFKKVVWLIIFGLLLQITLPLALAEDNNSQETEGTQDAMSQLKNAHGVIDEIQQLGIKTNRLSDLLLIASATLELEVGNAKKNNTQIDLTKFNEKMLEFRRVSTLAVKANDELIALKQEIDLAEKEVPDISPAIELYNNAKIELENERFERVIEFVDDAYEKILELQSIKTRAEAIYEATAGSIVGFFSKHYIEISTVIIVVLISYLILNARLKRARIREKIFSLETERKILDKELKKAQEDYFIKGTIPEGTYNTRITVFGEMVRDITKELAVLKEEEAKLGAKKRVGVDKILAKIEGKKQ